MATLDDISGRLGLTIVFEPETTETGAWYRMFIIKIESDAKAVSYCSLDNQVFMRSPVCEFSQMNYQIGLLLSGEISSFSFTPDDERDYELLIGRFNFKTDTDFRLYIHTDKWEKGTVDMPGDKVNSGFSFRVTQHELARFRDQLTSEFETVVSRCPDKR